MAFHPIPKVPQEIADAAQSGELVVFVGAGISRLVGCPSWDGFANNILRQLIPDGINYYVLSQIQNISDPKKRLSIARIIAEEKGIHIDYGKIFQIAPAGANVYTHLNSFNSSFVTTNYDKLILPHSSKTKREDEWRLFKRTDLLGAKLDVPGNVIHLHGSADDPKTMVITTKDYLEHYASREVQEFLKSLFERKTVLFLGYGLEETEVLEYILRRGEAKGGTGSRQRRRFILQGFFEAEVDLYDLLRAYYRDAFEAELISFPKDFEEYAWQIRILEEWAKSLSFERMTLTDELAALEDEIRE